MAIVFVRPGVCGRRPCVRLSVYGRSSVKGVLGSHVTRDPVREGPTWATIVPSVTRDVHVEVGAWFTSF